MKAFLPAISGLALAVFPLVVVVGARFLELSSLWWVLTALLAIRTVTARWFARAGLSSRATALLLLGLMAAVPAVFDFDLMLGLRFYPVMANIAVFTLFFASLFSPVPLVERIARLHYGPLPPEGRRYTRGVTMVWAGFLFANTLAALATALWASDFVWGLYNGLLSYGLVAVLFAVEYLVRRHQQRGWSAP